MITIAIVPILVQAGAALLPTLVAGVTTVLAVMFQPGKRLRVCREKPAVAVLLMMGIVIASLGSIAVRNRKAARVPVGTDWAQVALEIIRNEQRQSTAAQADDPHMAPRNLRPAWEFKLPGTSFLSTPVVAAGRVYGASCQVDVGGTFGSVFCLDAQTGKLI